jgi:peptidoglycan/xylan/chitin deacetylase (PgdA/CDA1 family)
MINQIAALTARSVMGGTGVARDAATAGTRHHVAPGDLTMDDGYTALRQTPPSGTRPARRARGLPLAPHHRRRRAAALLVLAGIALIVGVVAGAGAGGGAAGRHVAELHGGYFIRIRTLAGNGTGSFAVSERAAENGAISRTLSYTPYVRVAGAQHREIALTFDDGPGPYTPQVLAALERYHVPATFFEVGVEERYFHAGTAAIVARGYPIGDHTQSHAPMSHLSAKDQQTQLLQDTAAIGGYGVPFPRMFRPPYGLWNPATLTLLKRYRMLMVLWSVDTDDYQLPGVRAIVDRAVNGAKPGAIILLHDAGGNRAQTVAALPQIIKRLRARGYKLVTIPRLLLDNPAPKDQHVSSLAGAGG